MEILNIKELRESTVKRAHRKLMIEYHPDKNGSKNKQATHITQRINQARDFIENKLNPSNANNLEPS